MPNILVREGEPLEMAYRRFKRTCEKAGISAEVRSREFHEKPTTMRKRKAAAAKKRLQKRQMRENPERRA